MEWLEALQASGFARFLQQTVWVGPALEILHYFGIILWLGAVIMLDLKMIGLSRRVPLHNFHLSAGVWAGLGLALISGALMFATMPVGYVGNAAFWVKIALIVAASVIALIFHSRHVADPSRWDRGAPPMDARIAGALSLALWVGALAAGRLITVVGATAG